MSMKFIDWNTGSTQRALHVLANVSYTYSRQLPEQAPAFAVGVLVFENQVKEIQRHRLRWPLLTVLA